MCVGGASSGPGAWFVVEAVLTLVISRNSVASGTYAVGPFYIVLKSQNPDDGSILSNIGGLGRSSVNYKDPLYKS